MIYRVRRVYGFNDDGSTIDAECSEYMTWPVGLLVGGLYYLWPNDLYRIVELVRDD